MDLLADRFGEVAEVGRDGDFEALGAEGEADGVDGVVGDGEAVDVDVADDEAAAGLEELELGGEFAPRNFGSREPGAVDRDVELLGDGREAGDVVRVFVGDEDRVEGSRVGADGREAFEGFLAAEAGVDQQARAVGGDQRGVAGGRGREDGEL